MRIPDKLAGSFKMLMPILWCRLDGFYLINTLMPILWCRLDGFYLIKTLMGVRLDR